MLRWPTGETESFHPTGRKARSARRRRDRTGDRPRAFGLLELLVAMVLFIAAVLAGVPLLIRGLLDIRTGGELSAAVTHAGSAVEVTALRRSLDGAGGEPLVEHFSRRERRWIPSPPEPPDRSLWERRTALHPYPLEALDDGLLDEEEALPAGADGTAFVAVDVEVLRPGGRGVPEVRLRRLLMVPESP